jgi:hypothetical protein
MDCLQGMCQMQVGPLPFAEGYPFCGRDIPRFEDPSGLGRSINGWQRQKFKSASCWENASSQGPPPYVLQLRNWGKWPHSLALKHNKSLGKKCSTTSKSLDLKQRRTIMYFGIGFWPCCLYLGLESTYSSSKCLLYFEGKCILSRIWEVGGTSKHEKTGFCNYFFCSTELKVSNATTIWLHWTKSKSLQRPVAFLFHKQDL